MLRRRFLAGAATVLMAPLAGSRANGAVRRKDASSVRFFLAGDVMTGRGIDQILPTSSSPEIYEQWLRSASDYIAVAERVSGPIPREVDYRYIWGDALPMLETAQPDVRLVNLETAVTISDEPWPGKGIHYRMHPDNIAVLTAAGSHLFLKLNSSLKLSLKEKALWTILGIFCLPLPPLTSLYQLLKFLIMMCFMRFLA